MVVIPGLSRLLEAAGRFCRNNGVRMSEAG
jgi:hypothetical protein